MATIREKVENNVVVFLLTAVITGFGAGFGAYPAILAVSGREAVDKERIEQDEKDLTGLEKLGESRRYRSVCCGGP